MSQNPYSNKSQILDSYRHIISYAQFWFQREHEWSE